MKAQQSTVLFLCPSLVGAGVERRVYTLFNQLSRDWPQLKLGLLRREGIFLSQIDPQRIEFIPPKRWTRWLLYPLKNAVDSYNLLLAVGQIRNLLRHNQPQLLVTFTLEASIPMYLARRLNKHNKIIWLISEDSNTALATQNFSPYPALNRRLTKMLAAVYRKADFVTTVSTAVNKSVQAFYQVPQQNINILHNPIDIRTIKNKAAQPQPQHFSFDYILAVGRLMPVKQFDLLIEAYAQLDCQQEIKLIILGEGPQRDYLEQIISEKQLTNNVILPGFSENPWVLMRHAKMLVLSSALEGFGNVLAEAMVVGCSVIATDCGGPADIIQHHHNGLLVPASTEHLANAMQTLLDNPAMASQYANTAQQDAQRFSVEHNCKLFEALLLKLLDNKQSCKSSTT